MQLCKPVKQPPTPTPTPTPEKKPPEVPTPTVPEKKPPYFLLLLAIPLLLAVARRKK